MQSVIYKTLAVQHKVTLLEYTVLRNFAIILISTVIHTRRDIDPLISVPQNQRYPILWRAIFGTSVSLLINASLELIPFSLLVILFQTNPFWTTILGYFINKEHIFAVELIGIIICFAAVIVIVTHDPENFDLLDT